MILLLTIYYLASHGTQALPIQDIDKSAQSCQDLGHCRTIWDIIWSCVVTIFSCTWLAIHPNIPGQGEGWGWRFLRRVGMFISAVIVPELMIYWAIRQWVAARELKKKYKKYNWTRTHGFFAIMGGFMLYEGHTSQYILDPWKLEQYLISGQIDITEDEIQDRSKGDILTKGLVVLQTSWFIIQLIARGASHLPVTELEIATLAYASLNFVTYGVWWNKPLSVEFPVRVYSNAENQRHSVKDVTEKGRGEGEMVDGNVVDPESLLVLGNKTSSDRETGEGSDGNESTDQKKRPPRSSKLNMLYNILKNIWDAFQPPADSLTSQLWRENDHIWHLLFPFLLIAAPFRDPKPKHGAKRVPTFYSGRIHDVRKDALYNLVTAVTLVTVLFGGIHCLAWAFPFPTHTEQFIWRVSSIFITTAPMATLVIALVADSEVVRSLSVLSYLVEILGIISLIITFIFYPLSRLILLVQALMTLRLLAPGAYATVQWTTFIPHI